MALSSQQQPQPQPIEINPALGKLPVPPVFLYYPVVALIAYLLCGALRWGIGSIIWITLWGWILLPILMGKNPHRFTDKAIPTPGRNWIAVVLPFVSPIVEHRPKPVRELIPDYKMKLVAEPRKSKSQRQTFKAFHNFVDLLCLVADKRDGRYGAAALLEAKGKFQLVFPFRFTGLHDHLSEETLNRIAETLSDACKNLPQQERITWHTHCHSALYAPEWDRIAMLDEQIATAPHDTLKMLLKNEQVRVKELSAENKRLQWDSVIFCTWTASTQDGQSVNGDFLGKITHNLFSGMNAIAGVLAGTYTVQRKQFFIDLLRQGFEEFSRWELLLGTQMALPITAMSEDELFQWLWNQTNPGKAPLPPQVLVLESSSAGDTIQEIIRTPKHPITVLTENAGACPEHRGNHDRVILPALGQEVGFLNLSVPPKLWVNHKDQLNWTYKIQCAIAASRIAKPNAEELQRVHDYGAGCSWLVELSPASQFIVNESLSRLDNSHRDAIKSAQERGARDAGAEVQGNEVYAAQLALAKGEKAVNVSSVLQLSQPTPKALHTAQNTATHHLGVAKAIPELNLAWSEYLGASPLSMRPLLQRTDLVSEKRLTVNTKALPGFLPLIMPQTRDRKGIELITVPGRRPIYFDPFGSNTTTRVLINGGSGVGKSLYIGRNMLETAAQGHRVVGIDISTKGSSTFKYFIHFLRGLGAFYPLGVGSQYRYNIMQPPNVAHFPPDIRETRLNYWKSSQSNVLTGIIMGGLDDPSLAQRVETLLGKGTNCFINEPEIIERYNAAFLGGWQSAAWQDMPVLRDFRRFCTLEWLDIHNPEAIDHAAIRQIQSRLDWLLESELGEVLGSPSTFNPDPLVMVFALSGLSNAEQSYIMGLVAHAACMNVVLSSKNSLYVGEELNALLTRPGFGKIFSDISGTGRKDGLSLLLACQTLPDIAVCPNGPQILGNLTDRFIGACNASAAKDVHEILGVPYEWVQLCTSDAARPRRSDRSSFWLWDRNQNVIATRYYPSDRLFGLLVNDPDQRLAFERVLSRYPDTLQGNLKALADFNQQFIPLFQENAKLQSIA